MELNWCDVRATNLHIRVQRNPCERQTSTQTDMPSRPATDFVKWATHVLLMSCSSISNDVASTMALITVISVLSVCVACFISIGTTLAPRLINKPIVSIAETDVSRDETLTKLTGILRDVFDDDSLVAAPELTADDVDEWDSLNHVRLILTVEREFRLKFAASEVTNLKNLGDLVNLIEMKA
jgi:acyl carrier protein